MENPIRTKRSNEYFEGFICRIYCREEILSCSRSSWQPLRHPDDWLRGYQETAAVSAGYCRQTLRER